MILSLQTNAFGAYGGIATYNRLVCGALNDFGDAGRRYVLFAADSPAAIELPHTKLSNLTLNACNGKRTTFVQRLLRVATHQRVELLLVGHVNYAPLGLLLKRLQPQMRYGVMMYGIDVWTRLSLTRRLALQQADFTISISEYTKERAIEVNGVLPERVHLLPNALEWNRDGSEGHSTPLPGGTRLLTVCRLDRTEKYKGVDTVIEALPAVAVAVPDVQYLIVGSGSDAIRLKRLAARIGISQRVHFLGSVDDATLRSHYQACDVFVMPSAKEGFGFVFLEAMAHSKPVVAADRGGSPEVVLDGITGLLVRYGDVPELARALTHLCLNPRERERLGQAGYERLQKHFTFGRFRKTLTGILRHELPAAALYRTHCHNLTKRVSATNS